MYNIKFNIINDYTKIGIDKLIEFAIKEAKELKLCQPGENVIVVMGLTEQRPEDNPHNIIKIIKV